jgi:hypothetical protein
MNKNDMPTSVLDYILGVAGLGILTALMYLVTHLRKTDYNQTRQIIQDTVEQSKDTAELTARIMGDSIVQGIKNIIDPMHEKIDRISSDINDLKKSK